MPLPVSTTLLVCAFIVIAASHTSTAQFSAFIFGALALVNELVRFAAARTPSEPVASPRMMGPDAE